MFVILSKLLPAFVYPLGLSVLLLAVAAALRGRPRLTRALCLAALALLLTFSSWTVANGLLTSLENQYPRMPIQSIPRAEAIVALGGADSQDAAVPGEEPDLARSSDRLLYAARLYRAGKAPFILFSGGAIQEKNRGVEAANAARLLREWLVPQNAIVLEGESRNTRENALFSMRILRPRGVSRIILVTSAFHMPRAVAVFRKVGFQVIPAPADFKSGDPDGVWPGVLPSVDALAMSQLAAKEWLGIFVYRLRGWV